MHAGVDPAGASVYYVAHGGVCCIWMAWSVEAEGVVGV